VRTSKIVRTPNTLAAHRLIQLAGGESVENALVEALFQAYFSEGRDISDRQTLLDVVAEAGLDRHRAEAELDTDEGLAAMRADEAERRFSVGSCGSRASLSCRRSTTWPCRGWRSGWHA
jgi:predicted DsbA family dithiol-disulfide isomerase